MKIITWITRALVVNQNGLLCKGQHPVVVLVKNQGKSLWLVLSKLFEV